MKRASEEIVTKKEMVMCCQPYPWLVIRDGKSRERQMFYSITKDRYYVRSIPQLQNKYIAASCKEWLVLADNTQTCLLLNISTMEKVQLPPIDITHYAHCVLSSHNIDASCRVLFFHSHQRKFKSCYIGDSEFVEHDLLIDFEEGLAFTAGIAFDGKLYINTMDNHLMCADFTDPFLHFKIMIRGDDISKQLTIYFSPTIYYLVESFGELFFIYKAGCGHELSDLKIFRADLCSKTWVPVQNLGDRALFLDASNCFVASPASALGLTGNSVYYVNNSGRNLFVYNMKEDSTTISLPCLIASHKSALSWVYVNSEL